MATQIEQIELCWKCFKSINVIKSNKKICLLSIQDMVISGEQSTPTTSTTKTSRTVLFFSIP